MRLISSPAVLSVVASLASVAYAITASEVVELTNDSYGDFLKNNNVTLVEFFAPWCGHCKQLEPEYKKAAEKLVEHGIRLANVNCVDHDKVCSDNGISGYPTLKIFKNGSEMEYAGPRDADGIVKQIMPAVTQLKLNDLEAFAKNDDVTVVGVFPAGSKEAAAFNKVAESLRNDHSFASVEPGVYMIKKFDEGFATFKDKEVTEEALKKWVSAESIPLMSELTPENFSKYVATNLPMAYLFYEKEEMRKEYGPLVEEIMKKYKGKISAVYIDGEKYHEHAKALALPVKWPGFVIHEMENDLKYPFSGKLTSDELGAFVEKYANNKLEPSYRSEDVPAKDTEPVKTVVFKNWDEIVMDEKKDVLLELYAPWCGACKNLSPVYTSLAKSYDAHSDKVVIAKMDATANDIPKNANIKLTKFPTIILFKAGAKKEQVPFEQSGRTVKDFAEFIAKHGGNKVVVTPEEPKAAASENDKEEL